MANYPYGKRPTMQERPEQARARMQSAAASSVPAPAPNNKKQQGKQQKKDKGSAFRRSFGRLDIPYLTLIIVLMLFGLVMLFSASYPTGYLRFNNSYAFILPQIEFALLGLVAMAGATLVDYHHLKRFAWPLMMLTMLLLVIVLFMPGKNGANRWIWLNRSQTQSFQPSELAKFAVILLFAALISTNQKRIKTFSYGYLPFMLILGMVSALLLKEPHLSCTILVLGIGFAMLFAGGGSLFWLGGTVALGLMAAYLVVSEPPEFLANILPHYADDRIAIWQDPFQYADGNGHQIVQSLIAVGSGGLTGTGIGGSVQKFLYLPEMYNDYIFAVLCEELGFVGAITVIVLFLLLFIRGLHIALRAKDKFGAMLVVGVSTQIALQTFLHIAVNANAIPSTGISLPFFSSGGTSLVILMGEIGVLLSVSRQGAATVAEARKLAQEEESRAGSPDRPPGALQPGRGA